MRKTSAFVAIVIAAPFVITLALVLLTILQVTAPIFEAVSVSGPTGETGADIAFNATWIVFATVGTLAAL